MTTTPSLYDTLRDGIRRAPALAALVLAGCALTVAVSLLTPRALAAAVDAALRRSPASHALVVLAVVLAAGALARVVSGVAGAAYGARVTASLRRQLVGHVLAAGPAGLQEHPAGALISRLTVDAESPGALLPALGGVLVSIATSIGAVVLLGLLDFWLVVAFVASLPLALVVLRAFMTRAPALVSRYEVAQADVATRLLDAHGGSRSIRAAGTLDREVERVLEPLPQLSAAGHELWAAQRRVGWQAGLLLALVQVAVLAVAGLGVSSGSLTPGDFLEAGGYAALALAGLEQIDTLVQVARSRVGAGRVAEVLAAPTAVAATLDAPALPVGPGALAFRAVAVDGVLEDVDLDIAPGTTVALVGRSGVGKSTLASLVGRLADPDAGAVLLDGVPLASAELGSVRRAVAYAFARPASVGGTVRGLIALGSPDATPAQLERAARLAEADTFVRRLPHGYDTALADAPLSGGERQRLGLAQALLQDARVVVLDDATSSLDTATEARVSAAIEAALVGRTALVVARRAATAARADLVAWIDDGRVRAFAPHDELWRDPAYRAVFEAAA
jgi:ATP-binding cassette subfamily B protein